MAVYHFSIITPNGKVFDDQIQSLTAPGVMGSFGILASHAPMVNLLKEGILKIKKEDTIQYYKINSGILEVGPKGEVVVLCDEAVETTN